MPSRVSYLLVNKASRVELDEVSLFDSESFPLVSQRSGAVKSDLPLLACVTQLETPEQVALPE